MQIIPLIVAFSFCLASVLLVRKVISQTIVQDQPDKFILGLVCISEVLFLILVTNNTLQPTGINFSFVNIFSLVSALIVLLYILSSFNKPVEILGILIFPIAAISILLQYFSPNFFSINNASNGLQFHILLSLLAYSLLAIAACQAILLSIQNGLLKKRQTSGFIRSLPSLESMEKLLFRIISLGFILLTLGLFSGVLFIENIFAQHLVHKTVLSIVAWVLYGLLLWGNLKFGWRGKKAVKLTISGFIFLMLAYFGSKFVSELILHIR